MIDLYNSLKESLLDNEDDQLEFLDKVVSDNWFKAYAKGDFKIKDKKKSLGCTIVGNMIIDKYEGETIPVSCWTIKGNLYITNCPNLKTINGFIQSSTIDGGLYIENCVSLESLEGCPKLVDNFSCVGNRRIKSLVGAPEHVFGNCYIMKNGKKFSEEQIKTAIEVSRRIDCNEEDVDANITEALTEPHLLKFAEYLKSIGGSFKRVFDRRDLVFDKITSKDVTVYSYPHIDDNAIKDCRKIISDKESGYIIVMNHKGEYDFVITSWKQMINITNWKGGFDGRSYPKKSTELIDICNRAEELILIKCSNELTTWKLQSDRREARSGMIMNTERQNQEIARENVKRYKKLAAQMRAEKNQEYKKIDEAVEKIIMRALKVSQIAHRDPDKYNSYEVSYLNEMIYDKQAYAYKSNMTSGKNGLLYYYDKYTTTLMDIKKGNAYDYQIRDEKLYEKKLWEKIKEIEDKLSHMGV